MARSPSTTPSRSATTTTTIADALRADIASGALPNGAALAQNTLAARFNVSHIPVREALRRLESDGLVVIEPNRGAFVASPSADDVRELFDLRIMLECDALRHAFPRHTRASILRVRQAHALLETLTDRGEWEAQDREFHALLVAQSGRTRTMTLLRSLRAAVERFCLVHLDPLAASTGSRPSRIWKPEHRAIVKALEANDSDSAELALRTHLENTANLVLAKLTPAT
jgi:DNA-binding GntR family transcriptional regulator